MGCRLALGSDGTSGSEITMGSPMADCSGSEIMMDFPTALGSGGESGMGYQMGTRLAVGWGIE